MYRKAVRGKGLPTSDNEFQRLETDLTSSDCSTVSSPPGHSSKVWSNFAFTLPIHCALCVKNAASLEFVDLISMGGLMYSMAAHRTDHSSTSCPLCSTLWAALVRHVDEKHSYARGSYQEGREKRLAALRGDPVLVFLNPLCLDERNEEFGTLSYQLC
jgi:hypothetical protein